MTDDEQKMVQELLDYEPADEQAPRLTDWEIDFVESLQGLPKLRLLSARQRIKLRDTWHAIFG